MKLGVFDSGHGGELVADKLRRLLPEHDYTVANDLTNAPYGERSYAEIRQLTEEAIQPLLDCDIIVIACNTATAAAIEHLRAKYPNKTFVGFEPMIKPAAAITKSGHITLLATKATAYGSRTEQLITNYAPHTIVDRPTTFGWARSVDEHRAENIKLHEVEKSVAAGSDTIIIGCTHYIALIPRLKTLFPNVAILEPTDAVAKQITRLIGAQQPQ